MRLELRGRQLVGGSASGPAVVVDAVSFYGDVDPRTGVLRDGRQLGGRVLVARRPRGSTVGSYIIYALRANGVAPAAIVMSRTDPIVVAGCVLASIPLVSDVPEGELDLIGDGDQVKLIGDGRVIVEKASH
ncbi:MAG: aconitase X swivel domain-containing protein [Acidilobus sp.]